MLDGDVRRQLANNVIQGVVAGEAYTHTRGESSAPNGHRVNAPRPPQFPEPIRDRKDRTAPVGRTHRFCTRVSFGEQSRHERRWQVPSRYFIAAVDSRRNAGSVGTDSFNGCARARTVRDDERDAGRGPPGNITTMAEPARPLTRAASCSRASA